MYCPTCGSAMPAGGVCPSCSAAPAPGPGGEPRTTSGLAITSFVLGIISVLLCGLGVVTALPGLILGIVSLGQTGRGQASGRGFAIAGTCLSAVGLLAFIPVIAAIAIPNLLASRVASNEAAATAALRAYVAAQATFRRQDHYGKGKLVYANTRDGKGFPDLYEVGGQDLKLIDRSFAEATSPASPKAGYYFVDIEYDDPSVEFGLCAVPAQYPRSGRNTMIVDATGTIYMKDTGGQAVTRFPEYMDDWIPSEVW